MNENSNQRPMMYKSIPEVSELNKVQGFDPLKFLRRKVSKKTNEEVLQLDLPYQKLWFRLRHPQGRMKVTALRITEQMAIMEAKVFLDRSDTEPISSYISKHHAEEGTDYIQAAQDEALSDALSDAGFGLQFADVGVDSTGRTFGSSIPLAGAGQTEGVAQKADSTPPEAVRQTVRKVNAQTGQTPQNAATGQGTPIMAVEPKRVSTETAQTDHKDHLPVAETSPAAKTQPAEMVLEDDTDTLPAGRVLGNTRMEEAQTQNRVITLNGGSKAAEPTAQVEDAVFHPEETEEELPVAGTQEATAQTVSPSYTESTPVEEILQMMTFEEAQNVVVDTGVCSGKTLAAVAKERPVSLRFYLTPGYKSKNNIIRAAAQIMLDEMAAKKAG